MKYTREAVIPTPQNEEGSLLVAFKDEQGRLRNVTIKDQAIANEFQAHHKELDKLAEEYSRVRQGIVDKRQAIEEKAFVVAEKKMAEDAKPKPAADVQA